MSQRTKPNLGWNAGGWIPDYKFPPHVAEHLSQLVPCIDISAIESAVGEYQMWRDNQKDKPTLAERRANIQLLHRTIDRLISLLGPTGIDQASRDHIFCHLALANLDTFHRLENDLEVLRRAIRREQRELAEDTGGREPNFALRMLADSIKHRLQYQGIKVKTTKTGHFVTVLEVILEALGEPRMDAQYWARMVLRKPPQASRRQNR